MKVSHVFIRCTQRHEALELVHKPDRFTTQPTNIVAGNVDEQEQGELSVKIKVLREELEKVTDIAVTSDMFISTVRKYTRAKKLSTKMLNELIERIEVFHAEKIDGVHVQKLIIHYHFIGAFQAPEIIPMPEISMQTRRGVTLSYSA